jgi:hypothetical protein
MGNYLIHRENRCPCWSAPRLTSSRGSFKDFQGSRLNHGTDMSQLGFKAFPARRTLLGLCSLWCGGFVRRKRRVELHIEHREISVFAGTGPYPTPPINISTLDGAGLSQARQSACPTCGSSELVLMTDAVTNSRLDLATLNQGMQNGSVHFHRSPSGEWWICTRSLQQS